MTRGVFVARLTAAIVFAALVPLVVSTIAHAGSDDRLPGLAVTSPVPRGFEGLGAVRFRAIGALTSTGDEYLGVADLGVGTNRIEANFSFPRFLTNGNTGTATGDCRGNFAVGTLGAPSANDLRFSWDRDADSLTSRITNATVDCTLTFSGFAQELATAKGWTLAEARDALQKVNALLIDVDSRQSGAAVSLGEATVDGVAAVGSFAPGTGAQQRWLATGYDFDTPGGFTLDASLDLGGAFGNCADTCGVEIRFGHIPPPNEPPIVALAASDSTGQEGSALATGGMFTDPDGDPLTITGTGAGDVVDHGDGTWSWTLTPTDDGADSVLVAASDGKGGEAIDRFAWTASNVAPTITALDPSTTTVLVNADVVWTASASDPGTGDELIWSFDDGAGTAAGATTTFTTRYGTCGTYALQATVTDDDGGSTSATSEATVTAIAAQVLEPVGADGEVVLQRGRVLPVKVRVGCGDENLAGLHPEVWFGGALVGSMREQDGMYRFNLRLDGAGTIRIAPFGAGGGTLDVSVRVRD